jgi:transglutaminase-like putative cysteine protease
VFFEIAHATTYTFSRPVFLEPHTVRLRPRCDGSQRLIRFDLQIEPTPAGLSEYLDVEGNCVVHTWFDGSTESLRVMARCEVETLRENPFDYIVHPSAARLPVEYADDLRLSLAPYCSRDSADDGVAHFANSIADEVDRQSLPFLAALNRRIFQMCQVTIREEGEPQPSEATLAYRRGACRDLAVLFMDACRALGLGVRFVSGYQEGDPEQERRDLHAWAEVYVPGGGWRGYDPTHGLAVADRHVAVAAGIRPGRAAPITGTFRGTGASSRMQSDVRISVSGGAER